MTCTIPVIELSRSDCKYQGDCNLIAPGCAIDAEVIDDCIRWHGDEPELVTGEIRVHAWIGDTIETRWTHSVSGGCDRGFAIVRVIGRLDWNKCVACGERVMLVYGLEIQP